MAQRFTENHEVTYYECDVNQRMTFPAMLSIAVKVSEDQSDSLNRGADFVHTFGLTWVITTYQIKINRLPKVGENIKVSTKATSYNKYFCYRNFWFHNEAGEELVMIETVFALMNIETRKMSSVPEEVILPFESEKIKKIKRYPVIEKIETGEMLPYRVRYYDIDSNHHVNNSVYFNWMIDILGLDFLTEYTLKEVNVRFDKEVEYGVEIESHVEKVILDDEIKTRHEIRIGQQLYCEANIQWQKNN
ncbi:medium-chain acyl-[acyl-carrier-protein] hydrolase [Enterococcus sp. PF1-24]|uniref:acyl-ACP thioesterase domain-containing protein n=1 Tax=unclassified Enterococcus TaxID=2608891 RepID=UPI0024763455|nr:MULTISPECIES: acyl-ACP thioesterase domain-containing protein [unclassified Enterococcus]MDH6365484.1 medium-chain acyl-[acyl-carrier-protein] hydrolase [Enterococcus sp. PFB1-1]MDH6402585.1 medium-chain acyl-[acyl-carrier-protein] hydrolase [Enterococcus sp. PF1-24]